MSFKHTVVDSRGQEHKRVSASRAYSFAVIRHYRAYDWNGRHFPARSCCGWSSRLELAQKELAKWAKTENFDDGEIIPCTALPTGKHAELTRADAELQQAKRDADRVDGYDRDDLGESHD